MCKKIIQLRWPFFKKNSTKNYHNLFSSLSFPSFEYFSIKKYNEVKMTLNKMSME